MSSIDLTPLYRNSVGFDRLSSILDSALNSDNVSGGYPPYNIEVLEDNKYLITVAVAGFEENELDINVEKGVLTIKGKKAQQAANQFLHRGIAHRAFERKFNLLDHVEVKSADLHNGLLQLSLLREIPEAEKPKSIAINTRAEILRHRDKPSGQAA